MKDGPPLERHGSPRAYTALDTAAYGEAWISPLNTPRLAYTHSHTQHTHTHSLANDTDGPGMTVGVGASESPPARPPRSNSHGQTLMRGICEGYG